MRTHYGPWQPCWIWNQHQKHKSGRGPSSEHFRQVWLKSVQRFQRRRFKCEKLTDGRTLTHDKSSHGLWPGELKTFCPNIKVSLKQAVRVFHSLARSKCTNKWINMYNIFWKLTDSYRKISICTCIQMRATSKCTKIL